MWTRLSKAALRFHIVLGLVCVSAEYVQIKYAQTNITYRNVSAFTATELGGSLVTGVTNGVLTFTNNSNVTGEISEFLSNKTNPDQPIEGDSFRENKSHAISIINRQIDVDLGEKGNLNTSSWLKEKGPSRNKSDSSEQDRLAYRPIRGIEVTDNSTKIPSDRKGDGEIAARVGYKNVSDALTNNGSVFGNRTLRDISLPRNNKVFFNETLDNGLHQAKADSTVNSFKQQEMIVQHTKPTVSDNETIFKAFNRSRPEKYRTLNSSSDVLARHSSLTNPALTTDPSDGEKQKGFSAEATSTAITTSSINGLKPVVIKSTHSSKEPHYQLRGDRQLYLNDEHELVKVTTTEGIHLFTPDIIDNENEITTQKKEPTSSTYANNFNISVTSTTSTGMSTQVTYKEPDNKRLLLNITKYLISTLDVQQLETSTLLDYDSFNITVDFESANESEENGTVRMVQEFPWPVKREAVVEGDIVLGGLMMVHEREEGITCGPVMPQGGIQALEAMLYTLDKVNEWNMLPNITIGAHILDDCDKDTYGLEMAVDFIKGKS